MYEKTTEADLGVHRMKNKLRGLRSSRGRNDAEVEKHRRQRRYLEEREDMEELPVTTFYSTLVFSVEPASCQQGCTALCKIEYVFSKSCSHRLAMVSLVQGSSRKLFARLQGVP